MGRVQKLDYRFKLFHLASWYGRLWKDYSIVCWTCESLTHNITNAYMSNTTQLHDHRGNSKTLFCWDSPDRAGLLLFLFSGGWEAEFCQFTAIDYSSAMWRVTCPDPGTKVIWWINQPTAWSLEAGFEVNIGDLHVMLHHYRCAWWVLSRLQILSSFMIFLLRSIVGLFLASTSWLQAGKRRISTLFLVDLTTSLKSRFNMNKLMKTLRSM